MVYGSTMIHWNGTRITAVLMDVLTDQTIPKIRTKSIQPQ
jgi:hypothetical protein